jgi:hypothetical protein
MWEEKVKMDIQEIWYRAVGGTFVTQDSLAVVNMVMQLQIQ